MGPVLETVLPRATTLGDLAIRRLLPAPGRRLVGPWCFLDAFGPLAFDSGKPMDVPPHPHVGLQTVTWLLDGEVLHRDSLGSVALARPGALNLMTAGRGIAHSEETPEGHTGRLEGVQLWVALPNADRDVEPSFEHHPEAPEVELPGATARLVLGEMAGRCSPGRTYSPIVGADVAVEKGASASLPLEPRFEHAVVALRGDAEVEGAPLAPGALLYVGTGRSSLRLRVAGGDPARVLLLGGAPFGEAVLMWWNFVARSSREIEAARDDWEAGRRFGDVRGHAGARTSAPPLASRPARGGSGGGRV